MAKEITVTIHTDIIFKATKEEEELIKAINEIPIDCDDDYETYDMLKNMLEDLLLHRIHKEMKNLNDVDILDTEWD
jgi:hypothetical protein